MSAAETFESGDAIAVVDARLRITGWNAAAEALTGITPKAAVGAHCWQVLRGSSEHEGSICEPGCRMAIRAIRCGDVAGRPMVIRTPAGIRRIWITTIAAQAEGRSRIVHVLSRWASPEPLPAVTRLTARERDVLSLLGEGLDAAAISDRLGISVTTVRTHIRHILAALGVRSQLAAVAHTYGQHWSYDVDDQS